MVEDPDGGQPFHRARAFQPGTSARAESREPEGGTPLCRGEQRVGMHGLREGPSERSPARCRWSDRPSSSTNCAAVFTPAGQRLPGFLSIARYLLRSLPLHPATGGSKNARPLPAHKRDDGGHLGSASSSRRSTRGRSTMSTASVSFCLTRGVWMCERTKNRSLEVMKE